MIGERITPDVAQDLLGNLYNPAYTYSLVFDMSGVYITAVDGNGDRVDSDVDLNDDFTVNSDFIVYDESNNLDDIWDVEYTASSTDRLNRKVTYYPIVVIICAVLITVAVLYLLYKGGR